jgi:hypothetical protein
MINLLKRPTEDTMTANAAPDPLAKLRALLAMPPVPAELQLAKRRLSAARQARDAAHEHANALRALSSGVAAEVSLADVAEAQGKFEALRAEANHARADRDRLIAPYERDFLASLAQGKAEFIAALAERLDDLERVARIGVDLQAAAAREGVQSPVIISRSREIVGGIQAIRAIINDGYAA